MQIIKFSYTNRQIFLSKSSNFPVGIVKFSKKIIKFSHKYRQIFLKKLWTFRTKIVKIFLQKFLNFPAKIDRFPCKKH